MFGAPTTPPDSPNFGTFTLLAKVARGDIGDLFLARSRGAGGFEKLVIIKRIHAEFMRDREISELFHSEAQTAARIEHPNVRIIYEIGSNEEHHYIALEYLQGVPLVDLLLSRKRDRRLADPRLLGALLSQACQGLHAAHKISQNGRPFVHGDINPRSIFVTDSGTSKLLDFDIVQMRGALAKRHGFVRRTIAYMSPEEVRTKHCDHRSDIFSLGVVAWEAITGKRLFKQETREQTLAAIDRGRVPNAKDLRGTISDALNATIMRALSHDASLRFQSAQDFGSAIDRALLSEGPPLTPVAISTLIKDAFGAALQTQRDFVQTARNSQDGAHRGFDSSEEFEKPTVVATRPVELDEWSGDEPATTVGGEEFLAAIQAMGGPADGTSNGVPLENTATDPFKKISENADFSAGHALTFQDTRNLVLSEVEAESISQADDDEKTGAVVLPKSDALNAGNAQPHDASDVLANQLEAEAETRDQTLPGRTKKSAPSHLPAPLVARPETQTPRSARKTASASIYDRRTSAQGSASGEGQALPSGLSSGDGRTPALPSLEVPSPPPVEPVEVADAPAESESTGRLVPLAVSLVAVAAAVFFYLATRETPKTSTPGSSAVKASSPTSTASAPAKTAGAGAAEGILAAAKEGSLDAGATADSPDLDTPSEEPAEGPEARPEKTSETRTEAVAKSEERKSSNGDETAPEKRPASSQTKARTSKNKGDKSSTKPSKQAVAKQPAKSSKEPGFLTVAASPYATVFVDGKKRGITPLVKLKLKPGVHRLKLISSAGGKSKSMKVRITSGDVMRQNVRF